MKLGIIAGYSPATMSVPMELIKEAEGLGYDSVTYDEPGAYLGRTVLLSSISFYTLKY